MEVVLAAQTGAPLARQLANHVCSMVVELAV